MSKKITIATSINCGGINLDSQLIKLVNPLTSDAQENDGTEVAVNNLRLIGKFLFEIAGRIATKNKTVDAIEVVGLFYTLPYYSNVLPTILKAQLDAAHFLLPLHVVEDSSILNRDMIQTSEWET